MWFGLISLFPECFSALDYGITGRAIKNKLVQFQHWNPRDFTEDKHRTVDDRPYGGGPGMVMKVEPLRNAINAAKKIQPNSKVIHLSPQGKTLTQQAAQQMAQQQSLILVSTRYEGVDERLLEQDIDDEYSIGDYVLSGGELAAMVLMDAIIRCLPGALGHSSSAPQDSFWNGLLDYPQYTRPEILGQQPVPEVLINGNHAQIDRWRLKQSLGRTWLKRPDLIQQRELSPLEQELLQEFLNEYKIN